jgi:hypothetical protein
MKSFRAIAPVGHLKLKKRAKVKSAPPASITQHYMELLQLRGQVHELENRQRSAEQELACGRLLSSPSHQLRFFLSSSN